MSRIEYRTTDINEIDLIRPLWIRLNDYLLGKAGKFRSHYEQMTFDEQKAYFEKVAAAGSLHLDLAFDPQAGGKYVGYCVSSLSQEKTGEIESVFVEEDFRLRDIGSALVIRALAWFDEKGSVRNRVAAGAGNEGVANFYKKFGFYPRMMVLEQKRE